MLSKSTFDATLCNNVFEADRASQVLAEPTLDSKLLCAISAINRTQKKWDTTVKLTWYFKKAHYKQGDLYFPLSTYEETEDVTLMQCVEPVQRFLVSCVGRKESEPALPPAPIVPDADSIPLDAGKTVITTVSEAASHQLRSQAAIAIEENHKTVTYEDDSQVPDKDWTIEIPLFYTDPVDGQIKMTITDIFDQSRAYKLMNQRTVNEEQVKLLAASLMDTPGLVELPTKIANLICRRAHNRLNDPKYKGDIYAGLSKAERAFPLDPVKAIIDGSRVLIPVAGSHGAVAQVLNIKKAIVSGRYACILAPVITYVSNH